MVKVSLQTKLPLRDNRYLHKRCSNHFCPMQYMYKAYTLTHMLFFEQKLFPDFFCKYRLSLNRIFVCNETFTIYAQDITDYEYLKNIFEYYSDFENWPRISVTFFLDHSVYCCFNFSKLFSFFLPHSVNGVRSGIHKLRNQKIFLF